MRTPFGTILVLIASGVMLVSCPQLKEGSAHTAVPALDQVGYSPDSSIPEGTGDSLGDDGGVEVGLDALREQERIATSVSLESEPLTLFFERIEKMENTGEGLVRVLHYGDSHTAADFLTTSIRRSLQERFGEGGRGFVLLGKPWKSYRPKDVNMRSSGDWTPERILVAADPATLDGVYGLSGISVETSQSGASTVVETTRATGFGREASVFEVFYLAQPGGGAFRVYVDGKVKGTVSTSAKRRHTGFFKLEVPEGEHEFEVRVIGSRPVRLFGAVLEEDGPGIVYDTLGVNGGFFYTPIRWDAEILSEQVERRDPGLIVTMYGTNETDSRNITPESYKRKVMKTMSRFREGASGAACLMLGPPDRMVRRKSEDGTSQLDWIIDVQNEVADEIGCAFLDTREIMGGEGAQERWSKLSPPLAQKDGIHLTVIGYRELGERIADQIVYAYETYKESRTADQEDDDSVAP